MTEDKNISTFVNISVILTGFNEAELRGTGLVNTYYDKMVTETDPKVLNDFLAAANQVLAKKTAAQLAAVKSKLIPETNFNSLGKRVILMWYQGMWYSGDLKAKRPVTNFVSPQAFVESLAWPAAKTHPSGAKQPGFGSWSKKPL